MALIPGGIAETSPAVLAPGLVPCLGTRPERDDGVWTFHPLILGVRGAFASNFKVYSEGITSCSPGLRVRRAFHDMFGKFSIGRAVSPLTADSEILNH